MDKNEYMDESVFVPPWKQSAVTSNPPGQIQINPSTAIEQSKSRANLRQLFTTISMVAVLVVILIGGLASVQQEQKTSVDASVNLRQALRGIVDDVYRDRNQFTLLYNSSIDPKISESGIYTWTVSLPPGENFTNKDAGLKTCFEVPDITKNLSDTHPVPCREIVLAGREIIVEYLIFQPESSHMVAKTIIGQRP